jgi:hypothetical protein
MWNYRVIRKRNVYIDPTDQKERVNYTYAIHEAYYDKNGHVGAITQDPVEPLSDPDHEKVREVLRAFNGRLVTSNFIFDETITFCLYRLGHSIAVRVGQNTP